MFTHPIDSDNELIRVAFSNYSKNHFYKKFEKQYKGKRWQLTVDSIVEDIKHIKREKSKLQLTQQVDELWYNDHCWIFKYYFKIAGTKISAKASGNRAIIFLDTRQNRAEILTIYSKTDLPENIGEQKWIDKTLREYFSGYYAKLL